MQARVIAQLHTHTHPHLHSHLLMHLHPAHTLAPTPTPALQPALTPAHTPTPSPSHPKRTCNPVEWRVQLDVLSKGVEYDAPLKAYQRGEERRADDDTLKGCMYRGRGQHSVSDVTCW